MIYGLFWDVTQRMVVRHYHYSPRNNSEERRRIIFPVGGLKSRMHVNVSQFMACHKFFLETFTKLS
jgi:hypothetical protein